MARDESRQKMWNENTVVTVKLCFLNQQKVDAQQRVTCSRAAFASLAIYTVYSLYGPKPEFKSFVLIQWSCTLTQLHTLMFCCFVIWLTK